MQAAGWPDLFLEVPLKAVRAVCGSSHRPPRCHSCQATSTCTRERRWRWLPLLIFSKATDASIAGHLLAGDTEGIGGGRKKLHELCGAQPSAGTIESGRLAWRRGGWSCMLEDLWAKGGLPLSSASGQDSVPIYLSRKE